MMSGRFTSTMISFVKNLLALLSWTVTIYYENGRLSEETSWDIVVPNDKIKKVKKFLKDNT